MTEYIFKKIKITPKYISTVIVAFVVYSLKGYINISNAQDFMPPISGDFILPETAGGNATISILMAMTLIACGLAIYKTKSIRERFVYHLNPIVQKTLSTIIPGHKKRLYENTLTTNSPETEK